MIAHLLTNLVFVIVGLVVGYFYGYSDRGNGR
jgi:hypothetical protein